MKNFSVKKTLQVLYYLQKKTGTTDYIKLLKLCFLADRKQLRTIGIPLLFDNYFAMRNGPVCSQTKNILLQDFDYLDNIPEDDLALIETKIKKIDSRNIRVVNTGTDYLSVGDIKTLDFTIARFGGFETSDLIDITHTYPEWAKFADRFSENEKRFKMNYKDFFSNPSKTHPFLSKYLEAQDPFEELDSNLEISKSVFIKNYEN